MLQEYIVQFEEIKESLEECMIQTAYMVSISVVISIIGGILLGLLLYLTSEKLFTYNVVLYQISSVIVNIISSIPFLILMIFLLPLSALIVGTKIGSTAVIVPLAIAGIAFLARLVEGSLSEIDTGIIEAAISTGATRLYIVRKVILPEALPGIVRGITVTTVTLLGFSSMAGLIGGGGIGDLAYRYGFQRYNTEVMVICILILILLVQILQLLGNFIAKKVNHSQ